MKYKYISRKYWDFKIPSLSKTNEMSKRYDDVIDLSIGDPDFPCDSGIINQMKVDALLGHTKYTEFLGDLELREEISNFYYKYNCNYSVDNIMITSGGTHGMFIVLEAILNEGDEVIVISPYYIYYEPQIKMAGGNVVVYETYGENNFDIKIEDLRKKITEKTRAIIINSPNNPTGKVYSESSIKQIIELSKEKDFIIISDDIYGALNFTQDKKPICAIDNSSNIITIYSFSKDYSMTGFRLGYVLGDKRIIECIRNINESVNFTINSMAQRAGIYAIRNKQNIQRELKLEYQKRINFLYERIKNIKKMKCNKPDGTFYLFIDIRETGLTSEEIWELILDEAHVLVLPGSGFGNSGEGYIRIASTTSIDILSEAIDRIENMEIFK